MVQKFKERGTWDPAQVAEVPAYCFAHEYMSSQTENHW